MSRKSTKYLAGFFYDPLHREAECSRQSRVILPKQSQCPHVAGVLRTSRADASSWTQSLCVVAFRWSLRTHSANNRPLIYFAFARNTSDWISCTGQARHMTQAGTLLRPWASLRCAILPLFRSVLIRFDLGLFDFNRPASGWFDASHVLVVGNTCAYCSGARRSLNTCALCYRCGSGFGLALLKASVSNVMRNPIQLK